MAELLPFHKTEATVEGDFNNYTKRGIYVIHDTNNILNAPANELFGLMIVLENSLNSVQIIFSYDKMFFRRSSHGDPKNYNYSVWVQL